MVSVRFLGLSFVVHVRMRVLVSAMLVHMHMNVPASNQLPKRIQAERNQHYADAQLEYLRGAFADFKMKKDYDYSGYEQREGMAQPPQRPNQS